jgi:hypothetical protein
MPEARWSLRAAWPYLLLALVVIVLDQITKVAVLDYFEPGQRLAVIPGFFDLTLLFNRGAAFSFLAGHDGWQRWFFVVIAIAASVFILNLLLRHRHQRMFSIALGLIWAAPSAMSSTGFSTARSSTFSCSIRATGIFRRSTWPTPPLRSARFC